jgi:hypothetical protein
MADRSKARRRLVVKPGGREWWLTPTLGNEATVPDPEPPPPSSPALSGLFSSKDLLRWQTRAAGGPCKAKSDYATNSPGDWNDRIIPERNTAAAGTRTLLTTFTGASPDSAPRNSARHHAAAALVHVVARQNNSSDTAARNAAASFLLAQAREPATNFETNGLSRTANHDTLHGFSHLAQTWALIYDLLKVAGDSTWTTSEDNEVKKFLYHTANYIMDNVSWVITQHFSSESARWNETETLSRSGSTGNGPFWVNANGTGPLFWSEAYLYNNRRASMNTAVNMIAHVLRAQNYTGTGEARQPQTLIDHTQVFCREWVKYAVFPDGGLPDQERVATLQGESYLSYAAQGICAMAEIANRAMTHGDASLWQYKTSVGAKSSVGTPTLAGFTDGKSILFAQHALARHSVDEYERYVAGYVGNSGYRLDLRYPRTSPTWDGQLETAKAAVSDYYTGDAYLLSIRTRSHPQAYWPANPASSGAYSAYYGPAGVYPGWHFMFVEVV